MWVQCLSWTQYFHLVKAYEAFICTMYIDIYIKGLMILDKGYTIKKVVFWVLLYVFVGVSGQVFYICQCEQNSNATLFEIFILIA